MPAKIRKLFPFSMHNIPIYRDKEEIRTKRLVGVSEILGILKGGP